VPPSSAPIIEKFPIRESRHIVFRAEFFRAFNTPQFALPASTIGATGAATISSTCAVDARSSSP